MSTNYIDQITDTAGTTHDISEGDSTRIFRATCATAAATAAKVATLQTSNRNFSLAAGVRVAVTFTYGNSAATPTLRVDGSSTGTAKTIATATGAAARTTGNGTTYNTWGPYETIIFTYDGTYWVKDASGLSVYNAYALANSKTSNTGTVTSAGITAGTGISVSGSPITSSGSITVGHSNSVTAQTTQAVYPIKIDAQGHISSYGSAVTIPTVPSNIVNTITTTAGAHSAISSKTGAVSFNVPTKTSHLTNDSGFITSYTDELWKVTGMPTSSTTTYQLAALPSDTQNPITGYTSGGEFNIRTDGSSESVLYVGQRYRGKINLGYMASGNSVLYTTLTTSHTSNRTITLPNKDGTVALLSDIPTVNYPVTSVNSKTGAVSLTASDVGAASSGHTHTLSMATSSGTSSITLAASTKYQLTAGGSTYIFTTPPNTTYSAMTTTEIDNAIAAAN